MDPSAILLAALGTLVASLLLAGLLFSRGRIWQGLSLGLLPIAAMELLLWMSLRPKVSSCINSACAAAGLGPGCEIDTFACTEWTGIAALLFIVIGLVDTVVFLGTAALMALAFSRRPQKNGQGRDTAAA